MAYITGMMDLGAVVAALGGGPLAQAHGYGITFPLAAACAVLASGLVLWDCRTHRAECASSTSSPSSSSEVS